METGGLQRGPLSSATRDPAATDQESRKRLGVPN